MKKYQEENPNNSRIFINYHNKDNPVRFEYIKKDGIFKIIFYTIFHIWYMCLLISTFVILLISSLFNSSSNKGVDEPSSYTLIQQFIQSITNPKTLLILFIVSIPFFLTLIFYYNRRLWKLLPYLNSFMRKRRNVEFNIEDVKDNKVEIPLFSNVLCDYKAEGEFSKYLDRFEIVEHPFKIFKGKKKIPNEYLWKATWFFSQTPKSGKLIVKFN